ncbi:unnamed protein product [Symbiodinium natans]|uniref:Uncharacterized protein n=1 Tax=Symbiodinium natans TaxID=878477 RepID=A0A812SXW4_9DINO|nr:unnamed protein product [Symbiodinium natans]
MKKIKPALKKTSATPLSVFSYFVFALSSVVLPLSSAASARLLTGYGYWTALRDSWEDRHWHTWLTYLLNTGINALGDARGLTQGTAGDYLTLAQRWLEVVNSFV